MKTKKVLLLLLTLVMLLNTVACGAKNASQPGPLGMGTETAETAQPTDFETIDSPMIYNTTDSSKLPKREGNIGDVYGQVDNANASEITSMFSDEAWERFSHDLDRTLNFEPVEDTEAAPVLASSDYFVQSGGLASYLKDGNLLTGSQIGLQKNKEEKVRVLGTETNSSAWIYVVDKDALFYVVTDADGVGIPNALVTISYLDDSGKRFTRSVVATAGNTPGIAVFDEIPETFFGIVDIQAEGYRAVSVLDKNLEAGEHYTCVLEKSKANDLYIRGVDLSGKDLVNEETKLSLMSSGTDNLTLKVMVTKTGSASFPDSIEVRSDNRNKTVLTVSSSSGYDYDDNTRVYTAEKRWAENSSGLLRDGDQVSVKLGNDSFRLEHLTVKNALFTPGTKDVDMPVTTKSMPGNFADRLSGAGALNMTMQMFKVPVTMGFFPDGTMIFMAAYDIANDPDMETKYSSLFSKSWNPKNTEVTQKSLEVFERSFWENAKKVKCGEAVLNSKRKVQLLTNKNYNLSMSFSVFLRSNYNEATKDCYGTGGIMFCGSFSGGITEYFLFTAGPVAIPAYLGFEAGISINTTLNVSFGMDKPPIGEQNDTKWKYANNGDSDWSGRIEVIISFSVFGGIGVKGVLGVGATGYVNLDAAVVLGKQSASMIENAHSFIDIMYGMRIEYYLLFYSGTINLDCLKDARRIYDDSGDTAAILAAEALSETEFKDLDLTACAVQANPVLEGDADTDPAFMRTAQADPLLGSSSTELVDGNAYPDGQAQFVSTKNYTVLFQIVSNGERTRLIYQYQDKNTGSLSSRFYVVQLPDGDDRSVSEFVAVPNKTDRDNTNYCDMVYIGAILADNKPTDQAERMRSTDVAAIVVNLNEPKTISSVIASDPKDKGQYLYSAPMPAGREDYCSVVYAATYLQESNGETVNSLNSLMSVITGNTNYRLSYCQNGEPENRDFKGLGQNKVFSSGVIAPSEPSYWQVNPVASSDKWLVVKGYGSNGYYAQDLRCNFRIDIDGLIAPEDFDGIVNFDSIITNWQYLNGCNYFIAGDSVYWMNKKTRGSDPSDYEWVVEKVVGGSGIVSADNRYTMITNNEQSAVYLVGVIEDYDVNVEKGTAVKAANRVQLHTLTVDRNNETGKLEARLHGPLTLKFADGEVINNFTAAYNPSSSKSSGLSVVYATPFWDDGNVAVCMWKQNAGKGLLITDVKIPDYVIRKGKSYIEAYVTIKNYGYAIENEVRYSVLDEKGLWVYQVTSDMDLPDFVYYTGEDLYTGDSRVDKVYLLVDPNWELDKEHELRFELFDEYQYTGDIDDIVNSAVLKADNISFSAENTLIGGKHYVSTSITNNSIIGEETPIIQAIFRYADAGKERKMTFRLPTKEQLCRFDADDAQATEQVYRYDINLDSVWKEGVKDGLLGINFSLVNDAGEQQSNETVYLKNPMGQQPVPGVGLSPSSASGFISIYQLLGRTGSRAGKASSQKPPRSVNGIL